MTTKEWWETKTKEELEKLDKNYCYTLCHAELTTPTSCQLIRAISEIRAELERRNNE